LGSVSSVSRLSMRKATHGNCWGAATGAAAGAAATLDISLV
jgi:hypothetical protein